MGHLSCNLLMLQALLHRPPLRIHWWMRQRLPRVKHTNPSHRHERHENQSESTSCEESHENRSLRRSQRLRLPPIRFEEQSFLVMYSVCGRRGFLPSNGGSFLGMLSRGAFCALHSLLELFSGGGESLYQLFGATC